MRTRYLSVVLIALAACGGGEKIDLEPAAGEEAQPERVATVPVAVASREVIRVPVVATGTTEPIRAANLGPQLTARVERVLVTEGQAVEENDPLVRLDVQDARLQAAQAQASAAAAGVQAQLAESDYQRLAPLAETGTISPQRRAQLEAQRDALASAARAAGAAATQARSAIADATLRAPFAGVIAAVHVEAGELATMVPPTILVRLVDLSEIEIRVQVHERELSRIAAGDRVHVRIPSLGDTLEGQVTYIAPEVNAQTRSAEVVTRVPNADRRVRGGVFAEVSIEPSTTREGVVVPRSAIGGSGDETFVYTVADGVAHRVAVQSTPIDEARAEVTEGLTGGESVVSGRLDRVAEGARVEAEAAAEEPPERAEATPPAAEGAIR
jgi:membrane fusion protein, multidrug efflux system